MGLNSARDRAESADSDLSAGLRASKAAVMAQKRCASRHEGVLAKVHRTERVVCAC